MVFSKSILKMNPYHVLVNMSIVKKMENGKYYNGKMDGEWKWYRENGKLMQIGEFEDEKKTGLWKRYHPNGELYDEGEYINDKKTDEWKTYNATGTLNKKKFYKENLDNF